MSDELYYIDTSPQGLRATFDQYLSKCRCILYTEFGLNPNDKIFVRWLTKKCYGSNKIDFFNEYPYHHVEAYLTTHSGELMSNQRISADRYTQQKLGIKGNTITTEEAQQVQNKVSDSKEFKAVKEKDELVIKRVIRD